MTILGGQFPQANRVRRFQIDLPTSATPGNIKTIDAYLRTAYTSAVDIADIDKIIGVKLLGKLAAGTDRAALLIGDTAAAQSQFVTLGIDYAEYALSDHKFAFACAASASVAAPGVSVIAYIQ